MSVTKKPSGRRSVKVEVPASQSAAERRSAEAELGTLIDKFACASPAHSRNATVAAKAPAHRP